MAAMFQVDSLHFAGNVELNFALQLAYSVNASEFRIIYSHFHVGVSFTFWYPERIKHMSLYMVNS